LLQAGVLKDIKDGVKILGDGALEVQLTVKANKFSQSAIEKIQAVGGKAEVI
ncbi:MAG: uL15 family ribosomal protein, partial [Bacteroidota bacterium]